MLKYYLLICAWNTCCNKCKRGVFIFAFDLLISLNITTQSVASPRLHKLISIYLHCDLDLWPLTSKINRVHPLIMVNMYAKFDKEICNGVVSIVFTRSTHGRTEPRTHGRTEPQQRYYIPTATRCAGIKIYNPRKFTDGFQYIFVSSLNIQLTRSGLS